MFTRTYFVRLICAFAIATLPVSGAAEFVYVANFGTNDISVYSVDATGALTPIGSVAAGLFPGSVAVDPSGKFVYVANRGTFDSGGTVSAYTIGPTGALSPIGAPVPAGRFPESVAVDPTGKF